MPVVKDTRTGRFMPKNPFWDSKPEEYKKKVLAEIDTEEVKKLVLEGAKWRQLSMLYGCTEQALHTNERIRTAYEMARAYYEMSIVETQKVVATEDKSEKMLMWLGETELGQTKTPDVAIQINNHQTQAEEIPIEELDEWDG